ncbi:CDC48 family AAA ATPase [Candidatus Formimonas warabiya]|nr:CDC48 family AAA ATPase [Candidatus Formimonas warabiya]
MENSICLSVAEALTKDVGRGIARMDPVDMQSAGVHIGDVIIIRGKKESAARVMPAYADNRGDRLIQIDGITRENVGALLGDKVSVQKGDVQPCRQLVLRFLNNRLPLNSDFVLRTIQGLPLKQGDKIRIPLLGLKNQECIVLSTAPEGIVLAGKDTKLMFQNSESAVQDTGITVRYEDIGGLQKELQRIREMIELPLKYPALFDHLGIDPPRGVLLSGPPGTGKTLIARAVASEANAYFTHVNGPEIINKYYGESEAKLREIFETASRREPSIIFLDEIDAIAPKRQNVTGEVEKRVVAQLLALMDGLHDRGRIIVIGATNIPDALDGALRRPGRFDRELTIGIPDREGRGEILQIHSRGMPLTKEVDLDKIAEVTHGFVGADLQALCREAAMQALRRVLPDLDYRSGDLAPEWLNKIQVGKEDFFAALKEVEPSATRELTVEVPRVQWKDVGGLQEVKKQLQEAIEWPFQYEQLFKWAKIDLPKGILLYGPPGTGKTLLAKAMANEINANFISIKGPALLSKWVGDSEKALRDVFKKARQVAPCIIFFDEIDALVPHRGMGGQISERMLSQMLTEMDGVEELHRVVVLAATNRIDLIDPALLRPGRFDLIIPMPLPGEEDRREIIGVHLHGLSLEENVDCGDLAQKTAGFSGAELRYLCQRAALWAVREFIQSTSQHHLAEQETGFHISAGHFHQALLDMEKQKKLEKREG